MTLVQDLSSQPNIQHAIYTTHVPPILKSSGSSVLRKRVGWLRSCYTAFIGFTEMSGLPHHFGDLLAKSGSRLYILNVLADLSLLQEVLTEKKLRKTQLTLS